MTERATVLPYGRQSIDEADVEAVVEVLRSDWLTTGPAVARFERAFAEKVSAPHAVACANGTAGLHLAALALGLGHGDRVIVPAITFLATANAMRLVGAEVVFADVDPETGLMGVDEAREALARARARARAGEEATGPVKAIVPVHLAGQCADPAALAELAREEGLAIIEDACHAVGTHYAHGGAEHPVGACRHADCAVFSFHPVKTLTTGEGGMVTMRDEGLAERLRLLRNHGMSRNPDAFTNRDLALAPSGAPNPWYYEMAEVGLNYRLSDIHAALGQSQLAKLDRFVERRRALARRYCEALAPLAPLVRPMPQAPDSTPAWHLFVVHVDFDGLGLSRAEVMARLREAGIGTQVHYIPLYRQPYYARRYGEMRLAGAEAYYESCLSLPLFAGMEEEDVDRVASILGDICSGSLRGRTGI